MTTDAVGGPGEDPAVDRATGSDAGTGSDGSTGPVGGTGSDDGTGADGGTAPDGIDMEFVRKYPWLRPGDPGFATAEALEPDALDSGDPDTAALVPVAPPTGRDVAETAMRAVAEIEATISGLQAVRSHLLAGIGHVAVEDAAAERLDPSVGLRDVASELALLTHRNDRTVETDITRAMAERNDWPATVAAWGQARIHRGHVAVIAEIGAPLTDPEARAEFEAALLPLAEETTPGRLRALARRELAKHRPETCTERHRRARDRRGVFVRDLDDGMAAVTVIIPAVLAWGIHDRLTQMAKVLARAIAAADSLDEDAKPSFDHLRADLLCDLLLTGEPTDDALSGIRAEISVLMPATALLDADGVDDAIANLANGSPVDPETAHALAAGAKHWLRLFTDPLKGHVVAVDTYHPSDGLRRLLRARDQHCRWPGCMARAHRSDVDHTIPWSEGGKTEYGNLAHLCRRHHTLKGAPLSRARQWKVVQARPGVLAFTSPMGREYIDEPPRVCPTLEPSDEPSLDAEGEFWGPPDGMEGDAPF